MGTIDQWDDVVEHALACHYNMLHFTPLQELGWSNSAYCIKDQLQVDQRYGASNDEMGAFMSKLRDQHNILACTDLVFNHMASDATWIKEHPEATFNLVNSPHLIPAFLLDRELIHINREIVAGNHPEVANITDEAQLALLGRLIRELAEVDGLERIRYTTSHPLDMDDELIAVHGDVPQLMPYLHLPIQSGSNHVLQEMNRRHTSDVYLAVIDKLRAIRPDIAMSGDFIVGFPGERDADFAETLALVSKVGYASAYSFKYSPRPGTPAATAEIQVPESVKSERLESLQQLLNAQQFAFNKGTEGKIVDVLVERAGGRDGQMAGRSPYMQVVNFIGNPDQIGQIVPCRLSEARQNSMTGDIVNLKGAA